MVGAFILLADYVQDESSNLFYKVTINDASIITEVAHTPGLRAKGLMFRESLDEDRGMLFIYKNMADHTFWMANTKIPLDIIWVASNYQIVHIEKEVSPCPYTGLELRNCPRYSSQIPALYVIEVNGGWVDKNNVEVGDGIVVEIPKF